jgi:hypothetical protein
MTIPAHDRDAALELLIDGYRALTREDPHHPLLGYLNGVADTSISLPQDKEQLLRDRYAHNDEPHTVVLVKYYVDIRDAVEQLQSVRGKPYELAEDVHPFHGSYDDIRMD